MQGSCLPAVLMSFLTDALCDDVICKKSILIATTSNHVTDSNADCLRVYPLMSHDKEKTLNHCIEFCQRVCTAIWKLANNDLFEFCSQVP